MCRDATERLKKEKQSAAAEGAKQLQQLTDKNNKLQTALGNSEGEREAVRHRAETAAKGLREAEKRLKQLSDTVATRGEELRGTNITLERL